MVLIRSMINLCEYTCTTHTHQLPSNQLTTLSPSGILLSHQKAGLPHHTPPGGTSHMVISVHVTPLPATELRPAVFSLLPGFVSQVLLKWSSAHSFTSCLWLFSHCKNRVESLQQTPCDLQTRILPGPLQVCHPLP